MCGIVGFVGFAEEGLVERMSDALVHRGPDASGHWVEGDVALGHRRLSIIDLDTGQQPMHSACGRYVISFNGEVYNYRELRERLRELGREFRTESDTEVLLNAFLEWGTGALDRLNGMFAFAVFDRVERTLFLARDRVGIKPLYYAELDAGGLAFASEAKALLRVPQLETSIDAHAIHGYLALRYVPGDRSILREVRRLPAGHWLRWHAGEGVIRQWWRPPAPHRATPRSKGEATDMLAELMERSVRRRLVSDVPVGAYLSGGLDSSVIAAQMAKVTNSSVRTFSVGFGTDYEHDELDAAAATAERLGSDHEVVECRARDVSLLPDVVWHSDEPLGDPISIPMFQLARAAKKSVTVILTGEGADEIFGGYLFHKVLWAAGLYREVVPRPLRRWVVEPLVSLMPAKLLNVAFKYPAYLGDRGKLKALDYLRMVGSGTIDESYRHLISLFDARDTAGIYTEEFAERLRTEPGAWTASTDVEGSAFDQMLRLQFGHWLPDNMLLRNDKMSMASAIEGRVPFLDHELIEFAFSLPRNYRLRGMTGKWLLRELAERLLPKDTAQRRKMPFYVPIENMFEQPEFMTLCDELLSEESVRRRGIFRPEAVAELRKAMHRREFLLVKQVFSLVTLELWFRAFVDNRGERPA